MIRLFIGMLAAALLAGCIVVPVESRYRDDPSWYRHHRHDWGDRYHRYDYRDDRVLP